jgi:hypothetical protein
VDARIPKVHSVALMVDLRRSLRTPRLAWALTLTIITPVAACQRSEPEQAHAQPAIRPSSGAGYAKDIEALCNSVVRSGADAIEPEARTLTIANWLAANLTTTDSRTFLVKIQPLAGDAKAAALEAEAKQVGLPGCPLAAEWRTPPVP